MKNLFGKNTATVVEAPVEVASDKLSDNMDNVIGKLKTVAKGSNNITIIASFAALAISAANELYKKRK